MIFSGIEFLFFSLGVMSSLIVVALRKYHKRFRFNWLTWATFLTSAFLGLFCVAWSVSSVLEGEPRAASMGMLVFGLPSILFMVLGRRLALKKALVTAD